jgi:hypothetical protein
MFRQSLSILVIASAVLDGGCALVAPRYTASLENVQVIKDAGIQAVKVGAFDSTPGKDNANPISLRGSSLASPYDGSYSNYLAEAIRQELSLTGKLSPDAQIAVSGTLQKNDINIPVSSGTGDLEARFVVTRSGVIRYAQVKSMHDEWDSSFIGGIAIPRAQARYPVMMQRLLAALFADPAFMEALK